MVILYSALHVQVTDAKGHILFKQDDITTGKFSFTTEDYDMFEVCFHTKTTGECLPILKNAET